MSKPKISREALDRKITQIVLRVADHKRNDEVRKKSEEQLRSFQDNIQKQLDMISITESLNNIKSRGDLVQAFHNLDAEIENEFARLKSEHKQPLSAVVEKAVSDYLESIETFRKQGGEYFNGSVQYRPYNSQEKEALDRVLDTLQQEGYPVKVIASAEKLSEEEREKVNYNQLYIPLNFVTSLEGLDAFNYHVKAEGMPISREGIQCKRLFLDFTGQLRKPEDREFNPETDGHGGHVANAYEANAFIMGNGPEWQSNVDHTPKASKFITMAIAGNALANENKIFYMYSTNGGFTKTTPISLARQVEAENERKGSELNR